MATRRWFGELEAWLRETGLTEQRLAERSGHNAAHVLELFAHAEPNPKLALYLDLVQAAGARFAGVTVNEPAAAIARIKEIIAREKIQTVSALAKVSGINRSQLSSLLNEDEPNPTLATFDRLVAALGAEAEFGLVSFMNEELMEAVVVGLEDVEAVRQETKVRHLRAVPRPPATPREAARRNADAERAADAKAEAALAELTARVNRLHARNVELERQVVDHHATIDRMRGENAAIERLRMEDKAELARLKRQHGEAEAAVSKLQRQRAVDQAELVRLARVHEEDQAELARLAATKDWSLGSKIALGLGCFAAGVGAAALVLRPRSRSR